MNTEVNMRSLREVLQGYCAQNWFLFPLKKGTKMPAILDNLNSASKDIDQLMKWAKQFPHCNWGLSLAKSGLVAIDVDKKGLDHWTGLEFQYGEPQTRKAHSGSGIGYHFIFKAEKGVRYRGKIVEGIDVKHNGLIAVDPSLHPVTKKKYKFVNSFPIAEVPGWLKLLIEKPKLERKEKIEYEFGSSFYPKIIAQLKEIEFGYDEWLKFGMSLHAIFNGSDEGLDLYLDLSEGLNFKEGDLEKAQEKWESFHSNTSGVTGGTFIHLARTLGCEIPNPDLEKDLELFRSTPMQDETIQDERDEEPQWRTSKDGILYTVHKSFLMSELNKEYALLESEGAGNVIKFWTDPDGVKKVKTLNLQSFRNLLAPIHWKEVIERRNKPFTHEYHSAYTVWMKSNFRKTYEGIVFRPVAPANMLNLWSDIPCETKEGDVSDLIEFIENVICSGSKSKAEYLIDWMAHLVQKPAEKCITVPTLIGEQGTGKGLLTDGILRGILKNFYSRVDKAGIITERFNVEQSKKFLTVLDEASWKGKHDLAETLKSLTGNETMTVEEKFGGRYTIENYSRYMITSNSVDAVPIESTNRRYLILEISSHHIRNIDYYGRIWDKINSENLCEIFYGFLKKRDISKFNPKKFPILLDTMGQNTKVSGMGPVGAFWFDVLFEKPVPLFKYGKYLFNEEVYLAYLAYGQTLRHWKSVPRHRFWNETKNLIPILDKSTRHKSENGKPRAFKAYPYDVAKSFCERGRFALPEDFDELELLQETEFQAYQEAPSSPKEVPLQ